MASGQLLFCSESVICTLQCYAHLLFLHRALLLSSWLASVPALCPHWQGSVCHQTSRVHQDKFLLATATLPRGCRVVYSVLASNHRKRGGIVKIWSIYIITLTSSKENWLGKEGGQPCYMYAALAKSLGTQCMYMDHAGLCVCCSAKLWTSTLLRLHVQSVHM